MDEYIYNNGLRQEALDKNLTIIDTLTFQCDLVEIVATPFWLTRDGTSLSFNELTGSEQTCVNNEISIFVDSTNISSTKARTYICLSVEDYYTLLNNNIVNETKVFHWQDSSKVEVIYR